MKKIIAFLLAFLTLTMLFGCGGKPSTLNGVPLDRYAIVYSDTDTDYAYRAAGYIRDQIKLRKGIELPLQEDSQVTAEYEIVVGDTDREISTILDADTGSNTFAIQAAGKQIGLEGDYFFIAAAAYYFVQSYIPASAFDAQVPTTATVLSPITEPAKNCIFLIGDGMGVNHTKLYEEPPAALPEGYSDGESVFYGYLLGVEGRSRTNSLDGVTDSAAGGTALSSGYKTHNGSVGLNSSEQPVKTLTELANELGKATAVMSTEAKTGATPASFSAHATSREEKTDILKSQTVIEEAGTLINCSFDVYEPKLLERRLDKEIWETLDQLEKDGDGFFLMYEEAHIDKHSHKNDMEKTFLALARFNRAIGLFMEHTFYHPDTFLLITADHETGRLQPDENGKLAFHHDDHTDADVPVFAYGSGSEFFQGVTAENVQIPKTIAKFWGVEEFGDPSTEPPLY